jgi:predicted nucleotide-binding protein (sugar kinase/HSP70/actin superfamily)
MAQIKPTEKGRRVNAAYLVKLGKATPEQQQLAYEWFCGRVESEREANKRPLPKEREKNRNLVIAAYLKYWNQDNIKMSDHQACREIAADLGANESTVIRSFSKWKNENTDQVKERQHQRLTTQLLKTVEELIVVRNKED